MVNEVNGVDANITVEESTDKKSQEEAYAAELLKAQLNLLKSYRFIFTTIREGSFPASQGGNVQASLAFLERGVAEILQVLSTHPKKGDFEHLL